MTHDVYWSNLDARGKRNVVFVVISLIFLISLVVASLIVDRRPNEINVQQQTTH